MGRSALGLEAVEVAAFSEDEFRSRLALGCVSAIVFGVTVPILSAPSSNRFRRWRGPISISIFVLIGIGVVHSIRDLDRNIQAWITTAIVLLGLIGQLLWLLFFSGLRWKTRLAWLAALVLVGVTFKLVTRVDGAVSGTGLPRIVWRWTPTLEERFVKQDRKVDPKAVPGVAFEGEGAEMGFQFTEFLGKDRAGRVDGVRLSRDWATLPPKELWRHPVGLGWSGFVVANGLALTQEQRDDAELVTAYALRTGVLIWAHTNQTRFREWQGGDGPRATPTIVGDRVYAFGATGRLDCLELATGRLRWSVDVLKTNSLTNLTWGKSSSPLVVDGQVIVSGGTSEARSLLAFTADNGRALWTAGGDPASYASPAVATLAGRKQVLVVGTRTLAGHDLVTGARLWEFVWGSDKPPKCAQPVVVDKDRVFVSAGYGMGCLLVRVQAKSDGTIAVEELWRTKTMKTQFNNVGLKDGYLYGLDDGFLACVEVKTGKRLWKDGRYGSGQSLLVGDLVLVQAEPGFVALVEAKTDGFQELGRLDALGSKTWNNPALAGPYLLVRNDQEAICYQLPLEVGSK